MPLALLILFEEWGWEPLERLMQRIGRLPFVAWLERRLAALPSYAALVVFAVPWLLLIPVKLAAVALIAGGRPVLGTVVIVVAKVIGTAVLAWLFALTQPALMRLEWFASGYARWTTWKKATLAWVRASWAWRWGQAVKRIVRERVASWRALLRR